MTGPVSDWLSAKVASGALFADPQQAEAARALDAVLGRIDGYDPDPGLFGRLRRRSVPKGLYIWGGVGRGKSMLMDVFFRLAPLTPKSRVHFHAFMLEVHGWINRWRKMDERTRRSDPHHRRADGDDPIRPVARAIAAEAALLCFDEFHVTDITDAMILARLFEALWEEGVVVVATSNRAPEDLYENGLNRALFLPFIDLMGEHMIIHAFDGAVDHRLRALEAAPIYHSPLGEAADAAMDAAWARLTGQAKDRPTSLTVQGRTLDFPRTASGMLRADFDRLCGQALGPADYLAIAETFHTVVLDRVPVMGPDMRNEAKRFVRLIDALYETRTKLVMSADAAPSDLYVSGTGAFEFERTASRLIEMRSRDYLAEARKTGASVSA